MHGRGIGTGGGRGVGFIYRPPPPPIYLFIFPKTYIVQAFKMVAEQNHFCRFTPPSSLSLFFWGGGGLPMFMNIDMYSSLVFH